MSRTRVAFVANALTLGGTEKMLVSCVRALPRHRFDVSVATVLEGGPREAELAELGVEVDCAGGDGDRLAELLRGADVVHVFRHGAAEQAVPRACDAAGVPHLVETNIFGHVDTSPDERRFDCHLFLSKMCLLRYRDRLGFSPADFHVRHKTLSAPIEFAELRAHARDVEESRRMLGLDPRRPVVGRVGRAADLKWRNLVVDMIPHLLRLIPEAQILLVGATDAKVARLRRLGVLDRCVLHEPTLDPVRLSAFYRACDVFVSAAAIGESQGIAIDEALSFEVPVVTSSTPWADNAQVEFVEHGRSGWYASHPRSFAEATADLLRDPDRRRAFGQAGREDVERLLSPDAVASLISRLYERLAAGQSPPKEWTPDADEVEQFAAEYEHRARLDFRPLTPRERLEVRAARWRERSDQVAAVAGERVRQLRARGRIRLRPGASP